MMIRRRAGVYALYRRDRLYYVGLASNPMGRLKQHLRDRHHGSWDRFSVFLTVHDEHMKELESMLLRIGTPPGNKQRGRFMDSASLRSRLDRGIKEIDDDRRALLLGGPVARRRRRTKTTKSKGTVALAGLVDRRLRLKGYHRGYEYGATLRKDGRVSLGGDHFDSPTAVARAIVGRSVNGWSFWNYKNTKGEWVILRELKR